MPLFRSLRRRNGAGFRGTASECVRRLAVEVPGALRRAKEAGLHLFTLTDNTAAISGRQLTHGGTVDLFDRRFSVDDAAKRHKPALEAYAEATGALGASPSGCASPPATPGMPSEPKLRGGTQR